MNEAILIIIAIILFFFGYEIRPWIVANRPENRHLIDLIVIAVTITTILIPLISLIASSTFFVGSYFIVSIGLTVYMIYYVVKHVKELKGKSRKILVVLLAIYAYIFIASSVLMYYFAPSMPNIKL